ncbi:hypothetical protein KAR91_14885 [Candidatus Pacearchaeota archaeon]|nr:hypothetical protein [Candidatus Pacearchaeota archaeon]
METSTAIGWLVVAVGLVLGWFFFRLSGNVDKNQSELRADLQGQGARLDGDIRALREHVVYTATFEQHEKLEDVRYSALKQMHSALDDQLKIINGKIDTMMKEILKRNNGG